MDGKMEGWLEGEFGQKDGWMNECVNEQMDGWMDERTEGWLEEEVGQTDGWMNA